MSTASEHIAIIEDPHLALGRHCGRCGRSAGEDALIWTMERNERGLVWTCPECTRRNLAAIEGGLDQAFWD
ncbi:hypothetical protein Afil01_67910 [Actinorhabdospora filicis]|uniref:Uncharacterized protein n=1 Tax=Actinorhabdospora filicis TaxID=1785913 RepID=A0A9W6SU39_9ACTN|nr:hypothetical protein [Actinorhabdospora filicis]GLZ81984.1 hypothetical protein Afil01_67910 [Actinorhabdospora filicis]